MNIAADVISEPFDELPRYEIETNWIERFKVNLLFDAELMHDEAKSLFKTISLLGRPVRRVSCTLPNEAYRRLRASQTISFTNDCSDPNAIYYSWSNNVVFHSFRYAKSIVEDALQGRETVHRERIAANSNSLFHELAYAYHAHYL